MGALSPATEASTWAEEVDPTLEEETHAFDDEPLDFNGEKPPEVTEFELETLDMAADKQEVTTKVVRDWRRRPNGSEEAALSGEGVPVPCPVLATGLVSRHGSEFGTSQACRFCNVRAGAQAIFGAQKCLQRAFKRLF